MLIVLDCVKHMWSCGQYAPETLSSDADAGPCAEQRAHRGDDCDGGGADGAHPCRSKTDPLCSCCCCCCTAVIECGLVNTNPLGFDLKFK